MYKAPVQQMKENADIALLRRIKIDSESDAPLHAQVRQGLLGLIENSFEAGAAFFSEKTLIENLPVSQITVSRALRDLQREGLLLRERGRGTTVGRRSAAASSQNRASAGTAALKTIGMFVTSYESDYLGEMTEQLALACRKRHLDFQLYCCRTGDHLPDILRQVTREPDEEAFVTMLPGGIASAMHEALEQRGYRAVALEGIISGFCGSLVVTDARAAIRIGMAHLLELGHRRIVLLINEPLSDQSVVEKLDEFHRLLRHSQNSGSEQANIVEGYPVLCDTTSGQNSYQTAYAHMEEVWPLKPTAIFTVSDPGAWAVLKWLNERGISIPGEVSVLGFEDARPSRFLHPALSTVAHPLKQRAERTLEILCREPADKVFQEVITPHLVVRESTGPPPS
jgi:LacI family transcriptional regulator